MARLLSYSLVPNPDPNGWDYGSHRMFAFLRIGFQCDWFVWSFARLGHPGADAVQGMVADHFAAALGTVRE